jgi:hypothetical protein
MNNDQHVVQVRACRDNSCSELSNSVRIYYSGDLNYCSLNFELTKYRFWGINQNSGIDLDLSFFAGNPEYDVLIDWGDANVEHLTITSSDPIKFHHVYGGLGQYNGSLTIRDSNNCTHTQYFSVVVDDSNPIPTIVLYFIPPGLITIWAIYIMALLSRRRERQSKKQKELTKPRGHGLPPIRHLPEK